MSDPLRAKLPPGRHGLPADFVKENQRTRLLDGAAQAIAEEGSEITIASITKAAAVSRRTFYEHFDNRDALVVAMIETGVEHLAEAMASDAEPAAAVEHAITTLVEWMGESPAWARALILGAPMLAQDTYAASLERFARMLPYPADQETRRGFVVGGIASSLIRALHDDRQPDREALVAFAVGPITHPAADVPPVG